jgi:hypothetical protein
MLMPKATVHKDHLMPGWKHEVRFPGESVDVQPKSVTHPMDQPSHEDLGRCIRATDQRHNSASFFWRESIRHGFAQGLSSTFT